MRRQPPAVDARPVSGGSQVAIGETVTSYRGRKEGVVVIVLAGQLHNIGLADTARCAVDLEACRRVLENIGVELAGVPEQLQARCRELTKWKPRLPRY